MKLCASPANTRCIYQRIARDQAPTDQPDNTDKVQAAYGDLFQHLSNDAEGLELLKALMATLTGDLAQDDPLPYNVRPSQAQDADLRRRVAIGWQVSARKLAERFPGVSRIRTV